MQSNHKSCLLHRKKFLWNLVKLALFQICQTQLSVENYCSADRKSLKGRRRKKKEKEGQFSKETSFDLWLANVCSGKRHAKLLNFGKFFEPKLLPGVSNLNCLSRDHISIRRQNNVDLITCSWLAFRRQSLR